MMKSFLESFLFECQIINFLGGGGGGGNKTYHARIITLEVNYTNSDGVRKVSAQLQWSEALEIMDKG